MTCAWMLWLVKVLGWFDRRWDAVDEGRTFRNSRTRVYIQNHSKFWLRRDNIKSYLTPKVDPVPKQSNYKTNTQMTHVFRTEVQMFTPLFRDRSWFVAHLFHAPLPKKTLVNGLAGANGTRVSNFRVYLQKAAWTLDASKNWGDTLEPPCIPIRRTDPTQESCARSCSVCTSHTATWATSYRSGMTYYLPCLADLGYDAGVVDRIVPGVLLNLSITPPPPARALGTNYLDWV